MQSTAARGDAGAGDDHGDAGDRGADRRRPEAVSAACAGSALRRWVQA
jgi:hypothetical protein